MENFASHKDDNRLVYFDINYFDESALAPCTWDLAPLLAGIFVSAREHRVGHDDARDLAANCLGRYAAALAGGRISWVERETAQGLVKKLLEERQARSRKRFLGDWTHVRDGRRKLKIDRPDTYPVSVGDRARVATALADWAGLRPNPRFYK